MAKKQFNYSDLSPKGLEQLKEIYIDLKVKSMNIDDLKEFATEHISLQIKNTIGNDEELEAWIEMEEFFKDEFEDVIKGIQMKMGSKNISQTNPEIRTVKIEDANKEDEKKLDMWED